MVQSAFINPKRRQDYERRICTQPDACHHLAYFLHRPVILCTAIGHARKNHQKAPRFSSAIALYFIEFCDRFDSIKFLFGHILLVRKNSFNIQLTLFGRIKIGYIVSRLSSQYKLLICHWIHVVAAFTFTDVHGAMA